MNKQTNLTMTGEIVDNKHLYWCDRCGHNISKDNKSVWCSRCGHDISDLKETNERSK